MEALREQKRSPGLISTRSPHVREILRRIRRDYAQPITLRQIAAEIDRQSEYLGWLFKRELGFSFHECLTQVRLRRAARLIRAGEKIDAVALLVGYRSKKNFYDQFRRCYRMTPAQFRRQPDLPMHATRPHRNGTSHPATEPAQEPEKAYSGG